MDRVKVACAGMGRRSRSHLPVLKAMGKELDLVAVCDVDEGRARETGESCHVPHYTDITEMLEHEKPDVLDLTTPALVHHVGLKLAAERGVHVLVEVPMSYTVPAWSIWFGQRVRRAFIWRRVRITTAGRWNG